MSFPPRPNGSDREVLLWFGKTTMNTSENKQTKKQRVCGENQIQLGTG